MKKILPLFMLMMQAQAFHVIEGDQRVKVTNYNSSLNGDRSILKSIVRVNIDDGGFFFRRRSLCTGTLIAADKVLTAAHCLTLALNKKFKFTGNVNVYTQFQDRMFLPSKYKEKRKVQTIRFLTSSREKSFFSGKKRKRCDFKSNFLIKKMTKPVYQTKEYFRCDMVVLTLEKPFSKGFSIAPISKQDPERGDSLALAGFSADRESGRILTIDRRCMLRDIDSPAKGILKHDCDLYSGASGGPTFKCQDNICKIVGVNIFSAGISRSDLQKYDNRSFYNGSLMFTHQEHDLLGRY